MATKLLQLKQDFTEGLSQISRFWGFPKGMGAIFAALYLSPNPLSLDELVRETGLTKGAISTEVRTLARMGLVHRSSRLADRKDYYEAEDDFYKSIRSILKERQYSDFDRAIGSVREALEKLESGTVTGDEAEVRFILKRIQALQEFFNAIDSLTRAVVKLESLGLSNVKNILSILK